MLLKRLSFLSVHTLRDASQSQKPASRLSSRLNSLGVENPLIVIFFFLSRVTHIECKYFFLREIKNVVNLLAKLFKVLPKALNK